MKWWYRKLIYPELCQIKGSNVCEIKICDKKYVNIFLFFILFIKKK